MFLFALFAFVATAGISSAQTVVGGRITDTNGEPLAGVAVIVVGTNNATISSSDGQWSLTVEKGDELEFSCLSMVTVRRKFTGGNPMNIVMEDDSYFLNETIVIGYGTTAKSSLTGSVDQVRGSEILKGPSTNVSSVLAGKLTGISSVQESGQPGQDQASLRIRGSIYDVKYIVDGIPRDINSIDPNEIESISVLKDASAAAVYGLSGAGGVIIVQTRRGEVGATRITYNGSAGVSMNANYPSFLDGPQYAYYYNRALELDGQSPVFSSQDIQSMIDGTNGFGNTNWVKETFGTGVNTQHSVTVSGGTEKMRYFASLGYMYQKGNVENFDYTRYNARINIEANIAKNLEFSFGFAGQIGDQRTPGLMAGGSWSSSTSTDSIQWYSIAEQAVYAHPYLPITYDGYYVGSLTQHNYVYNPIAAINESGEYKTQNTNIQTNAMIRWNLPWVDGLNLQFTGSFDKNFTTNKNHSTPYYMLTEVVPTSLGDGTMTYSGLMLDPRGNTEDKLVEAFAQSHQLVGQGSINYDHTFAGKHDVKAMVLAEITEYKYNNFGARGKGLAFSELPELSLVEQADTDSGLPIYGSSSHTRAVGFVARLNYAYDNRYLFEVSGRYDGSYKFSGNVSGCRWGLFPSVSAAWRISNENFFEPAKNVLNELKIRASFGEVGTDNVSEYSFLSRLSSAGYTAIFNGQPVLGYQTSAVANPYLTWERTRSVNAGFDAIFWNRLLGVEFDAFYSYTYDILASTTGYPASMGGYYPTYSNNNAIDNRGFELTLSHDNRAGDFEYGIKLTVSWARARYVKYNDAYGTPDYQQRAGSLYYSTLTLVADGLFQTEEEIDNSPWYNGVRPDLGDIKYKDIDGDGVIDAWKDRTYSGRSNRPEWTGGLNFHGAWKGLDFDLMFTGGANFDVALTGIYYNGVMDSTPFTKIFKAGANAPVYLAEGSWTPENTNADFPRLSVSRSNESNNTLASTYWYRDGKYIRLKSAQIGYTFPKKWMNVVGIQQLRIYVEGGNLFTISGLPKGVDPESPGVNLGYYPQQRTVQGGLSITF